MNVSAGGGQATLEIVPTGDGSISQDVNLNLSDDPNPVDPDNSSVDVTFGPASPPVIWPYQPSPPVAALTPEIQWAADGNTPPQVTFAGLTMSRQPRLCR